MSTTFLALGVVLLTIGYAGAFRRLNNPRRQHAGQVLSGHPSGWTDLVRTCGRPAINCILAGFACMVLTIAIGAI